MQDLLNEKGWMEHLQPFFESMEWDRIVNSLSGNEYIPSKMVLFNPLLLTPLNEIKCVIVGDRPYRISNKNNGLCFGVNLSGIRTDEVSKIVNEMELDLGEFIRERSFSLVGWASQGVLMINNHWVIDKYGNPVGEWDKFTSLIIKTVAKQVKNASYCLLNNDSKILKAIPYSKRFDNLIIEASYPSSYSASKGFYGSRMFSRTNEFLRNNNINEIDWLQINKESDRYSQVVRWSKTDEFFEALNGSD